MARTTAERVELPTGTETVLVVEDDADVRALTRSILEASGYTVLEAANGIEAIELCEQDSGPIDLLLTDAIMPHMNGRVLAERVTQCRPGVRVLFMSGYAEDHILPAHMITELSFVQKPFTGYELTRKIRTILDTV